MKPVLINSIPKAGTNLLAKMLDLAGYSEVGHIGRKTIARNRLVQLLGKVDCISHQWVLGIDYPTRAGSLSPRWLLGSLKQQEYATSHIPYAEEVAACLAAQELDLICVVRDPRAIVSSFIRYARKQARHPAHAAMNRLQIEEAVKWVVDGDAGTGLVSLSHRCAGIAGWQQYARACQVRYEDLVGAAGGGNAQRQLEQVEWISSLLGIPDASRQAILSNLYGQGRDTFDKGRVDGWQEHLPAAAIKYIEDHVMDYLEKWHYV